MNRAKQISCKLLAGAVVLLAAASLSPSESSAKYVVVSKFPANYGDKSQRKAFYSRWRQERRGYHKHESPKVQDWHAYLKTIRKQEDDARLKALYKKAAQLVQYRAEREDVWSTPGETIARGYGDCDDYSHVYLVAATEVGFDPEDLWLVAGEVHAGGGQPIGHAIAVMDTLDNRQYVLDNLYGRVVSEREHKRFKPVYSINFGRQAFYAQVNTMFEDAL